MGAFVRAVLDVFPNALQILGCEINPLYVAQAKNIAMEHASPVPVEIRQSNFFLTNWSEIVGSLKKPILVIGNPPWVTNSELGSLGSNNVPVKSNLDNFRGIDALTGKSNFDISEWMIRKSLEWLNEKDGMLAMLCKTATARKILLHAWQNDLTIGSASIHRIDAQKHFKAAVDACLLLVRLIPEGSEKQCLVYNSLGSLQSGSILGFRDGMLLADVHCYEKWKDLVGTGYKGWRSGIKHDCSKVFELRHDDGKLVNGLRESVDVEPEALFPLLKSSDVAARVPPRRWLVVPQRRMGENPNHLEIDAPKTWEYLTAHARFLDNRKSSIYKKRPPFSIFGVGPYSFAPWKVAISGLYKRLEFVRVQHFQNRPVVLDDTCYFFPCQSENECNVLHELVMSEPAREFWSAFIFWDTKRPITAQILNLLDLGLLARVLGKNSDVVRTLVEQQVVEYTEGSQQRLLFTKCTADCGSERVANRIPCSRSMGLNMMNGTHGDDGWQ